METKPLLTLHVFFGQRNEKLMSDRVKLRSLIPGSHGWHSEYVEKALLRELVIYCLVCSSFYENIPSDYTVLHMQEVPAGGGDTL